jgi:hypothetical protein
MLRGFRTFGESSENENGAKQDEDDRQKPCVTRAKRFVVFLFWTNAAQLMVFETR